MPECKTSCVDTCSITGIRECGYSQHNRAIDSGQYITMVTDVTFTDGTVGPCYALVGDGCATAISIRRAIEMQELGYPFEVPHPVYPADFEMFFPPDFKGLGGNTMTAFVERTPESLG